MARLFTDNAVTTLAAGISSTDTTLNVAPGTGDNFPVVDGSVGADEFVVTLEDSSGNREFVKVTHRLASSDALGNTTYPCVRGYNGTTARAWSAGDIVDLRLTADVATSLSGHITQTSNAHQADTIGFDNTASGLTATEVQSAIDEVEGRLDSAESNISTHTSATSAHGVTSDVVGTTDNQALTNKTITAADNTLIIASSDLTDASDVAHLAGAESFTGHKTFKEVSDTVYALSGTNIDPANGMIQTKTITGATTFTESLTDGQTVRLILTNAGSNITWPTITWLGGSEPSLQESGTDEIVLSKISGTLYGAYISQRVPDKSVGNINHPLVNIPFLREGDEIALSGVQTFTRASTATYVDRYGVVQTAAINEPRFEAAGLLMEGASTNLQLYSEDFTNATWDKSNVSVSKSTTKQSAKNGSYVTEARMTAGATTAILYDQYSAVNGDYISYSWVVGAATSGMQVRLTINNAGATGTAYELFDLDSASWASDQHNNTVRRTIEPLANGLYRISATTIYDNTMGQRDNVHLYFFRADSGAFDGTEIVYIDMCQLEKLPFATSYIPTTSAAVTRAADALTLTFAGNMPNLNESRTTLADIRLLGIKATNHQYISNEYGVTYHAFIAASSTTRVPQANYGTTISFGELQPNTNYRLAARLDEGVSISMWKDGVLEATKAVTTTATGATAFISVGASDVSGSNALYGHIRNFRIYDYALSDEEMRIA